MPPVTILPNRLRLLTLPKSSLPGVTHALLRSFFFAESSALFSFTENALEISIVADLETVAHFDLSAPGLRVSADVFRALQIDNEEGLDNAGRRINELSGPLAHAGISIFYLSTYQTDLVFVKEKRLPLVLRALSDWTFTDVPSSERLDAEGGHGGHPPHPVRKLSAVGHHPTSNGGSLRSPKSLSPPIPIPVGMTHAASGGMTSVASQSPASSLTEGYFNLGSSFSPTFDMAPVRLTQMSQEESERMINEVRRLTKRSVLGRTLRLCGLNRDYMEAWALKLLRLVLYPDLVPNHENAQDRFFSYTSFDEGISLVADEAVLASTFEDHHINVSPRKLSCIQVDLDQFGLDRFGIVFSMSDPLTQHAINLLYLSTYRTANVLVSSKDLPRAMSILEELSEIAVRDERQHVAREGSESASDRPNARESFSSGNMPGLGVSVESYGNGQGMSLPSRYEQQRYEPLKYEEELDDEEDWRGKANPDDSEVDDFERELHVEPGTFSMSFKEQPLAEAAGARFGT